MSEDIPGGIEMMRQRIQRASRQPPQPKRSPPNTVSTPDLPATPAEPHADAVAAIPVVEPAPSRRPRRAGVTARRRTVGAGEPPVNLAIRVRRPLDDHLADLIHDLRRAGVRTSKVELIEMLLWELPDDHTAQQRLRERLGEFRRWAPRHADALPPE